MLSAGGCAIIENKANEGGGLMRLKMKWKVFLLALAVCLLPACGAGGEKEEVQKKYCKRCGTQLHCAALLTCDSN